MGGRACMVLVKKGVRCACNQRKNVPPPKRDNNGDLTIMCRKVGFDEMHHNDDSLN